MSRKVSKFVLPSFSSDTVVHYTPLYTTPHPILVATALRVVYFHFACPLLQLRYVPDNSKKKSPQVVLYHYVSLYKENEYQAPTNPPPPPLLCPALPRPAFATLGFNVLLHPQIRSLRARPVCPRGSSFFDGPETLRGVGDALSPGWFSHTVLGPGSNASRQRPRLGARSPQAA